MCRRSPPPRATASTCGCWCRARATFLRFLRLSRAGYRPLLEAGVRVFEWNGTMLHAKTAVADGFWARVGSTNLNIASWMGNYELDVAIEDRGFGALMTAQYEHDLAYATEIVLTRRNRVGPTEAGRARPLVAPASGSAGRVAAGAVSVGSAMGAALTNRRALGAAESGLLAKVSAIAIGFAIVAALWPRVVAWPLACSQRGSASPGSPRRTPEEARNEAGLDSTTRRHAARP